jgi:hypothetical protein
MIGERPFLQTAKGAITMRNWISGWRTVMIFVMLAFMAIEASNYDSPIFSLLWFGILVALV